MSAFAHFDAKDPLATAMCVSSFLLSVEREGLLVGRMAGSDAWRSLDHVASEDAATAGRVLPASHLVTGEDPEAAARRIAKDQLRAGLRDLRLARVLTFADPMPSRGQGMHWDLCFVYDADLEVRETPPWFAELRRVPLESLRKEEFSRGHGDVLARLGLVDG